EKRSAAISYSRFLQELASDNLKNIRFKGGDVRGEFLHKIRLNDTGQEQQKSPGVQFFTTTIPTTDTELLQLLSQHQVEVSAESTQTSPLVSIMLGVLPWLLIIGVWLYLARNTRRQGMGGMFGGFAKSGASMYGSENKFKVCFDDVAGLENS
ncbi:MAG: cell division protein FtsH, partial [Desulfuromonadaceae bacterium]